MTLKNQTIKGMIWSSVHRFGILFIAFITNLILARLLTPEDFGILGMILVFIAISSTLVDGGFASALIQKKSPTDDDYSTVFYFNLVVSLFLYLVLFFTAPAIEIFYKMPSLSIILRVQGLILIFNAFNIIQINQLSKQLNFKHLANINIISSIIGSTIGIIMAYTGFGVWSLVFRMLSVSFFNSMFFWFSSKWRPSLVFSLDSIRELFGFGSFMLMVSILNKLYDNFQALIIGRLFSATDLGFYTQAKRMEELPVQGLSSVVNQVTYPVLSQLQDNVERMKKGISMSLKSITFLNFPLMIFFAVAAKPLILLLLTDKWQESIPYLQILCFAGMLYTLNTINTNVFKSMGRSNMYFYVTLAKRVIGIFFIIIGAKISLIFMLYAIVFNTYLFFFINAYYSSKLIGYSILQQIKDISLPYLVSIISGLITFFISHFLTFTNVVTLIIQGLIYFSIYLVISYVLKIEGLKIYQEIIFNKIKK